MDRILRERSEIGLDGGELESGDRCVVKTSAQRTLIGVIDGVGHGREAAVAADAAAEVLETFAGESVSPLLRRCHAVVTHRTQGYARLTFRCANEIVMPRANAWHDDDGCDQRAAEVGITGCGGPVTIWDSSARIAR